MITINENILKKYLLENNVEIRENYFLVENLDDDILFKHVDLIVEIQKILMRYHSECDKNIISEIGRENSKLEVLGRRVREKYSMVNGHSIEKSIILKFNSIIDKLKEDKFKGLVKRAILRDEVCISKVDLTNLRVVNEIEIGKIKKISYNLIEEDFINYMKKVRKVKKYDFIEKCIDTYIDKSNLSSVSKEYILLKLNLQEECIKYLDRNDMGDISCEYLLKLMSKEDINC